MASPTVGTATIRIRPDFAGFNQAYGAEMKKHFGNFASRQLTAAGQTMTNAISKPLFGFFTDGLKVASDFYTTVGELSGIMAEKTGESYSKFASNQVTFMKDGQRVKDTFISGLREIARESKFSVNEMGQAATSLARSGLRSQQDMIGFLEVSQKVAAANREDLVATTEEMRVLSQVFNKTGTDGPFSDLRHIGDVITTVLTTSNMDLAAFSEGMKRAAPVANSLGLSIDDTASSLGVLANVGFKGSTASTALKNAMIRLRSGIPSVTGVLEKYNIVTEDSEGKSRPLVEVLDDMNKAGINTSDTFKVFGAIAGPAMSALLESGNIEKVREMTKNMENMSSVTDRLYNRLKETPEFKMEALSSNFEELKLTVVDNIFPAFSDGLSTANGALTTFIGMFQDMPPLLQKAVLGFGAAAVAIGPLALAYGTLGQNAKMLKPALTNLLPKFGGLLSSAAGGAQAASNALRVFGDRAIISGMEASANGLGSIRTAIGMLSKGGSGALGGIASGLSAIASSNPALAAIAVTIAGIGWAWYRSSRKQEAAAKSAETSISRMWENLSRKKEERVSFTEELITKFADKEVGIGKILNTPDYKTTMTEMGLTTAELAKTMGTGSKEAIKILGDLGKQVDYTTDSWWEMQDVVKSNTASDLIDSVDLFYSDYKDQTNELINSLGDDDAGKELKSFIDAKVKEAENAATDTNRVLRVIEDAPWYTSSWTASAEQQARASLEPGEKLISWYEDLGYGIVQTNEVNYGLILKEAKDHFDQMNMIYIEGYGSVLDITRTSEDGLKRISKESFWKQIASDEELQKSMKDLASAQANLGIGSNLSGFDDLSAAGNEALLAINALIPAGADVAQTMDYLVTKIGLDADTAFSVANRKIQQFSKYLDIARQAIPNLGEVMSTFTEDNPPTMAKAIDGLTKKYQDFATVQSKMKQLISYGGGQFTTLYQELSTLSADQQLAILKDMDLSDPDQIKKLVDYQSALAAAQVNASGEAVGNAVAAANANAGKGVSFIDPISKAFEGLAKEINGTTMTPMITPYIDPSFVSKWNTIVNSVNEFKGLNSNTKYFDKRMGDGNWGNGLTDTQLSELSNYLQGVGGRAIGGPVWPGLRTRVNELGREGFINSAGRFSMLPNTSSMRFNEYGTVIPAHMVGNRGGVTVVNHNNISGVTAQEVAEYQSSLTQAQVRRLGGGL